MADEQIPEDVDKLIDQSIDKPRTPKKKKSEPVYKVIGKSKIPVAKSHGQVWKSRLSMGQKDMKEAVEAWDEAIKYFENDQQGHRLSTSEHGVGNSVGNQKLNNNITATENLVFANVTTMVPALYARNPKAEFTSNGEAGNKKATMVERLVNVLGRKKAAPGVNLKPKAKRCVVTALLTNRAWLEVGWIHKTDSSEEALKQLTELAEQLVKAKTPKEIEETEGKIAALEQTIDILQPSGPFIRYKHPKQVIVDPSSKEADLTDANWIMIEDYLPTEFLKAKYGKEKGNEHVTVFKPTHIMRLNDSDKEDMEGEMADDYAIFKDEKDHNDFGFSDATAFEKAKLTRVYYVWDKLTRRVYLYNAVDWSWPLWVWDDPYQLDTFFPLFPLTFFEGVNGTARKGEVTYYLDQQDAINEIMDEQSRARKWARRNVFFNKNLISAGEVEEVLTGPDGTARGLALPPEMKLSDAIGSIPPPSVQFEALFRKDELYASIDRLSSTGEVLRGTQFKSHTTNDAVQANVAASNMRTDEKTDQIEDWMGQVYWALAQLCLQFWTKEEVAKHIGETEAAEWIQMSANEISQQFSVQVVGGSSKKPTSQAKKEEAIEVGQVLGQFGSTTPMAIVVALKLLEEAFDEITINEEDWAAIRQSIEQQMQSEQAQGQPAPAPTQTQQGSGEQPVQGGDGIDQLLSQLPPEIKQQMVEAINQGANPQEVVAKAQSMLQNATQPQA